MHATTSAPFKETGNCSGGSVTSGMIASSTRQGIVMARAQYFVVLHNGAWKIKFNGEHYGPYATQKEAIRVAVDTAQSSGKKGHDAQVLIQGQNNQFRTEWTYGNDPYPPPG